jgi:hypothetical protein
MRATCCAARFRWDHRYVTSARPRQPPARSCRKAYCASPTCPGPAWLTAVDTDVNAASPRLSVVIACLDAADVLGGQLAALAQQSCAVPWEVIVCDNGSRDGTVMLAESWSDRLPVHVIDASQIRGSGPARNAGVKVAQGEWIGFCDADDEVGDGWLAALCDALVHHPFVTGPFEDERLNSARTRRSRPVEEQTGPLYLRPGIGLPHAGAGNLGVHRSAFESVGGFDPQMRFLQDTDLSWRLQLAGHPLTFVPELIAHVRLRSTLRGMYRQGHNFGAAQARLERRYAGKARRATAGVLTGSAATTGSEEGTDQQGPGSRRHGHGADVGPPVGADPIRAARPWRERWRAAQSAVRLVRWFVSRRSSIGGQAWQIGWHIGHRTG